MGDKRSVVSSFILYKGTTVMAVCQYVLCLMNRLQMQNIWAISFYTIKYLYAPVAWVGIYILYREEKWSLLTTIKWLLFAAHNDARISTLFMFFLIFYTKTCFAPTTTKMYNFVQDDRCMTTLTVCTVLTYNTTVFTNRIVARFPSPIFFFYTV